MKRTQRPRISIFGLCKQIRPIHLFNRIVHITCSAPVQGSNATPAPHKTAAAPAKASLHTEVADFARQIPFAFEQLSIRNNAAAQTGSTYHYRGLPAAHQAPDSNSASAAAFASFSMLTGTPDKKPDTSPAMAIL